MTRSPGTGVTRTSCCRANGESIAHAATHLCSFFAYIDLPDQVKALRLVRFVDGFRLRKSTLHDLENFTSTPGKPIYYRLEMDPRNTRLRLELQPPPDRSYDFDVFYVPALSLAEFVTSSFPVRGWDEYLVLTASGKAKDKEEADIGNVMKERELLLERIKADLSPFDKSEPDVVAQIATAGAYRDPEYFDDGEIFS